MGSRYHFLSIPLYVGWFHLKWMQDLKINIFLHDDEINHIKIVFYLNIQVLLIYVTSLAKHISDIPLMSILLVAGVPLKTTDLTKITGKLYHVLSYRASHGSIRWKHRPTTSHDKTLSRKVLSCTLATVRNLTYIDGFVRCSFIYKCTVNVKSAVLQLHFRQEQVK